jgi:hypothetical protein
MRTLATEKTFIMLALVLSTVARGQGLTPLSSENTDVARWVSLPTDREIEAELPPQPSLATAPGKPDFARLMRPRFSFTGEWEMKTDGVEIRDYDGRLSIPFYPVFGPPPPIISTGFALTEIETPPELLLPEVYYDFSLGVAWVRPLSAKWKLRFMATAAFASDLNNTSSDAWQFRGGVMASYTWNPQWELVIGAFASGRDDIPVLPGIGAIWTPTPFWRIDLLMPRPRVSHLIAFSGNREYWVYAGCGLSGGTWAFEDVFGDDRLTYREWRLSLGLESGRPRQSVFLPREGLTWELETAYVFGRQFEFDRGRDDYGINGTLLVRINTKF